MATMTPAPAPTKEASPLPRPIPPLQNGDRLTSEEFHRRYEAMPHLKKAELIEGVVHMPSPVRHEAHSNPNFDMIGWLFSYVKDTPGIQGGTNGTLLLDLKSEPQPDAYLIVRPECGGRGRLDEDDYIVGGPELVGETSASTASYDLHDKLHSYHRNEVQEYVVWRVEDRAVDWFVLRGDQFVRLPLSPDGFYKSLVFPGLWLDPQALLAGDLSRLSDIVQLGLRTPEHAVFVQRPANQRDRQLKS